MTVTQTADRTIAASAYIGGAWQEPSDGEGVAEIRESHAGEVFAQVARGGPADVDRAVEAAGRAARDWSRTTPAERAAALRRIRDELATVTDTVATDICKEVGTPLKISQRVQVGLPLAVLSAYADATEAYEWETEVGNSLVVRQGAGVVGAITPWNYPLHQLVAKVGAALAAGCSVVAKPSDLAPLSALALADAVDRSGLPAGLVNIVPGRGPSVGEAIASHPGVRVVSFTGSTGAGARVSTLAAPHITKVALELGGKSASLVLDDADLERAVRSSVGNAFLNSGQTCSAWTRLIVPRDRLDDVLDLARAALERLTLGDPLEEATRLGPLVSAAQQQSVRDYIELGISEGARLVAGGSASPDGLEQGYYVAPTLFTDVARDMRIHREEIFGPVLVVLTHDGDDDAVALSNDSDYGLAGGVWSADAERAERVARRLDTGQVDLNGGAFNPAAPFGGFKQSGIGREFGEFGIDEFIELKSLQR